MRLTEDAHTEIEGILAENLIHHWDKPNGVFKNRSIQVTKSNEFHIWHRQQTL
jgi:hypothetical protein